MSWHDRQREKFHEFNRTLREAQTKALEMQKKADDARKDEPDISTGDVTAAISAYDARKSKAYSEAKEFSETRARVCRDFRNWCGEMRETLAGKLNDPALKEDERVELQTLHDEIVARLPTFEAECPKGDDPPPFPKATRSLG
jgi:hypothetical protein